MIDEHSSYSTEQIPTGIYFHEGGGMNWTRLNLVQSGSLIAARDASVQLSKL